MQRQYDFLFASGLPVFIHPVRWVIFWDWKEWFEVGVCGENERKELFIPSYPSTYNSNMVAPLKKKNTLEQTGFTLTEQGLTYKGISYHLDDVVEAKDFSPAPNRHSK